MVRKPAEEAEERSEAEAQGGMVGTNECEALGCAARDLG